MSNAAAAAGAKIRSWVSRHPECVDTFFGKVPVSGVFGTHKSNFIKLDETSALNVTHKLIETFNTSDIVLSLPVDAAELIEKKSREVRPIAKD